MEDSRACQRPVVFMFMFTMVVSMRCVTFLDCKSFAFYKIFNLPQDLPSCPHIPHMHILISIYPHIPKRPSLVRRDPCCLLYHLAKTSGTCVREASASSCLCRKQIKLFLQGEFSSRSKKLRNILWSHTHRLHFVQTEQQPTLCHKDALVAGLTIWLIYLDHLQGRLPFICHNIWFLSRVSRPFHFYMGECLAREEGVIWR